MGLEPQLQTKLYEQYWRPMEVDFGQEAYATHFDSFMRHYLTVKTGEIPNVREVYEAFKQHARSPSVAGAGVEALVADIRAFAGYYCAMALGSEAGRRAQGGLPRPARAEGRRRLPVPAGAVPRLRRAAAGARPSCCSATRWVESYVFRRAVCAIPTNSMNKTFATFTRALKKDRYLESIKAHFLLLPSYRRFPTDDEFQRELQVRDLYNFRSRSYWLRRLENHDRKERVPVDEYTIEHILPQNENLSAQWKADLGPEWERIQKTWLHTLGNLTLTGYNSELQRPALRREARHEGRLRREPAADEPGAREAGSLERGRDQGAGGNARRAGGRRVGGSDASGGCARRLQAEGGAARSTPSTTIRISSAGPMRAVFEAFRKQVLALDPCVTEEFLKLYVAYKAETNFVDVVPQAKRLILMLNMAFPEINDPKGICRDVSGHGPLGQRRRRGRPRVPR